MDGIIIIHLRFGFILLLQQTLDCFDLFVSIPFIVVSSFVFSFLYRKEGEEINDRKTEAEERGNLREAAVDYAEVLGKHANDGVIEVLVDVHYLDPLGQLVLLDVCYRLRQNLVRRAREREPRCVHVYMRTCMRVL